MINGINIDNIWDENLFKKLPKDGKKYTARVVVDNPAAWEQLRLVVDRLHENEIEPMIQIQDSFGEKDLSDSELFSKAEKLFKAFESQCSLWEIGNEVNGDWCSPNIADRVKKIWGMMPTDHKAALTLFAQDGVIQWYQENNLQVDYVFMSCYPSDSESFYRMANFDTLCEGLEPLNKNANFGVGEWGFENWPSVGWRNKKRYRQIFEGSPCNHPKWVGGFFYWSWQEEGY